MEIILFFWLPVSFFFSSLFFMSLLASQINKKNLEQLKETQRADLLGTSQPTLSRYIDKYEKSNIFCSGFISRIINLMSWL
jgi:predicted transcriptional regulator